MPQIGRNTSSVGEPANATPPHAAQPRAAQPHATPPSSATTARTAAALGALLSAAAVAGLLWAGALSNQAGYLSHLGAIGAPTRPRFAAALAAAALGIAALARAVHAGENSRLKIGRLVLPAAGALAVSAASFALTAAVPCSQGCPLPPYGDHISGIDLAHATFAVSGFVCGIAAIVVLAFRAADPVLRAVSALAAVAVAGCSATGALLALFSVSGPAGGWLQRISAGVAFLWLTGLGLRLALRRSADSPVPGTTSRHGAAQRAPEDEPEDEPEGERTVEWEAGPTHAPARHGRMDP